MNPRALRLAALAMVAACPAAGRAERIVDYAVDEATAAKDAMEQGVPLAPLPARGSTHVALVLAPAVDHEVVRTGIFCSAWKVQNPMSGLLRRFVAAWDRDGAPGTAAGAAVDLLVTVDRAATVSRCVGTGELKSMCITRVSIDGTMAARDQPARAFHVERESAAHGVGMCAGLTRGIGLVSRQAAADLVEKISRPADAS